MHNQQNDEKNLVDKLMNLDIIKNKFQYIKTHIFIFSSNCLTHFFPSLAYMTRNEMKTAKLLINEMK